MTALPVIERELRLAARKGMSWMRLAAALAVIVPGFVVIFAAPAIALAPGQVGRMLFIAGAGFAFSFCLLSGVFLTADCLSSEKREGTLGLLFLTDLKGLDVVLGKLAATSVKSIYALLAVLPMLGMPLLIGGVTGGEFWRLILVLVTTLLLSLAIGLLVSSIGGEARKTMLLTLAILILWAGLFPAMAWLNQFVFSTGASGNWWLLPSPVGALIMGFDSAYRTVQGNWIFWTSILLLWAGCLLALASASVLLAKGIRGSSPRCVDAACAAEPTADTSLRETRGVCAGKGCESATERARMPMSLFRLWLKEWGNGLSGLRPGTLEGNPFLWLVRREQLSRFGAWPAVVILGLLWSCLVAGGLAVSNRAGRQALFTGSVLLAFTLHLVVKIIVALEATHRFSDDQRTGALELLLVTRLSPEAIVQANGWLSATSLKDRC